MLAIVRNDCGAKRNVHLRHKDVLKELDLKYFSAP